MNERTLKTYERANLAELLTEAALNGIPPEKAYVEYTGCGSHQIDLLTEEEAPPTKKKLVPEDDYAWLFWGDAEYNEALAAKAADEKPVSTLALNQPSLITQADIEAYGEDAARWTDQTAEYGD